MTEDNRLGLWWLRLKKGNGRGREATHMCVMLSCFSRVQLFATPWIVTRQAPLSMGFSRQECWSGLPFPSPGDLPYPRIESESLMAPALAGRFFTICAPWGAHSYVEFKNTTNE